MFTKNTSKNSLGQWVLYTLLLTVFGWPASVPKIRAQAKPNLLEPFKKCWAYGNNNGLSRIIASDNELNLILTIDNYSLVSINPKTNLENWKSATGGKLEAETFADDSNLFFITSFEDENKERTFTLNSVSLKTGITNWQKKLDDYSTLKLNGVKERDFIYLTADGKSFLAVSKTDGETIWVKEFSSPFVSVEILKSEKSEELFFLLEDRLIRASAGSGEIFEEINLKKSGIRNSVLRDRYLFAGYATGEIAKINTKGNKIEILWKIKAGAGITGIEEFQNEVLVTSLDNFIYLFSGDSGKLKWKKRAAGRIYIKPLVFDNFALVVSAGDNSTSIVDLRDGKAVNQIPLEADNYFSGGTSINGAFVISQTYKGIYFFVNTKENCK
jgi:outer membrane protein assembly factor BamB